MWSSPGSEVAREQVSRRQSNPHAALRSQDVEVGVDRGGVDVVAGEENREHTYGRGGTNVVSELGLKLQGEGPVEGVRAEIAMVETPDGHGRLELTKFHAPSGRGGGRHAPANTPG